MYEVLVVGLIAQVWFVLHCFAVQKKQKFEVETVLVD